MLSVPNWVKRSREYSKGNFERNRYFEKYFSAQNQRNKHRSGRVPGIAPRHPPTPPNVRFSAFGGWTARSASFPVTRAGGLRTLRRVGRLPRSARRLPVQGSDRSCRAPLLRSVARHPIQCFGWLRSFLRPFARNAFLFVRSSNATMASADFPQSLNSGISPGQCLFFPFAPLGSTECRQ